MTILAFSMALYLLQSLFLPAATQEIHASYRYAVCMPQQIAHQKRLTEPHPLVNKYQVVFNVVHSENLVDSRHTKVHL